MNELRMMVGLPRSGKTTAAMRHGCPVVCPDAIRLAIHGQQFRQESEPLVWGIAHTMVEALFLAGHEKVVLDATNISRKRRDAWKSDKWVRCFQEMFSPIETCIARAREGGMPDLIPVIERMWNEYEVPTFDEYTEMEKSYYYTEQEERDEDED